MKRLLSLLLAMLPVLLAMAQEDLQKGAVPWGEKRTFTTIKENPITSIKNQALCRLPVGVFFFFSPTSDVGFRCPVRYFR